MTRLAPPKPEEMTEAQRAAAAEISAGPRGGVSGPFGLLLHSPELCNHVQRIGAFLRFNATLPDDQREFAIIMVGRHYTCQYEWVAHVRIARDAKLPEHIIQALAHRKRPDFKGDADLEAIYEFVSALLKGGTVEQGLYDRTMKRFGKEKVFELVGISGFYSIISMTLNTFDVEPKFKDEPLLPV